MKLIIHFLLLSSLSILIRAANPDTIREAILEKIKKTHGFTATGVRFLVDGQLGKDTHSIVWKGDYMGRTLAIKLTANESVYTREIGAFSKLKAVLNPEVETHGIPNVFIHGRGSIIRPYWGIGMTLLEENLEEYCQRYSISEIEILYMFKRGVRILEYLNEKEIIHNDIKPSNIFFRSYGGEMFFGAGDGTKDHRSLEFASSGFYANKESRPMDDLESLVFSLWSVADIERDEVKQPEGRSLAACKRNGTAKSKMIEKCNRFTYTFAQRAFKLIAADEMLKDKPAPDYKLMKTILDKAS